MRFLVSLNKKILQVSIAAITLLMALMVILVFSGVLARYVFQVPLAWAHELSRFVMIWISFLGAAIAISLGSHAGVTFLVNLLPQGAKKWLNLMIFFVVALVTSFLGWFGWLQVLANKEQLSPILQVSMSYPYLAIPFGSLIIILFGIEKALKEFKIEAKQETLKGN